MKTSCTIASKDGSTITIATKHQCWSQVQIGHICAFVPQFGSMIHKTQDEPLSLMMSQFVSEFIS